MCGVLGLIYPKGGGAVRKETLTHAVGELHARGPDDRGLWVNANAAVGFGHTRLAILDISSAGHQPMLGANGSALTYNGEIYNFRELRQSRLADQTMRGHSDSEVLLAGLDRYGDEFLLELDGMYAFAYFDSQRGEVLLAVDPAGEKPLYTYWDGRCFAFASELKALFALLGDEGDLSQDQEALAESLAFGYVPYPRTIYKKIRKLSAGHSQKISLEHGPRDTKSYWDAPIFAENLKLSFKEAEEQTRDLLAAAVRKRLVADVAIGSFLSGGLDSSAVSLEAAKVLRPQKLKTFAAAFKQHNESSFYDESHFAREVATRIGSEHYEIEIPLAGFSPDEIIRRFDEPYGDSSAIPTYLLCKETRKHVKVVLSGDGGDELFGGYLRFRAALLSEKYQGLWRMALAPLRRFRSRPFSLLSKLQRFQAVTKMPVLQRMAHWSSFFDEADLDRFLNVKLERQRVEMQKWTAETQGLSVGKKVLYYNFKTYLFDDLLPKVDRMSMSHGLEVRSPFLDKKLVEFTFRLPDQYKFDSFNTKKVLKAAYDRELGRDITRRAKHGFAYPTKNFPFAADLSRLREAYPEASLNPQQLSPLNSSAKKFMLWSLEQNLRRKNWVDRSL